MHSHDRTLLSSLGFADPDKKNPGHQLACQYLAQPDVTRRVLTDVIQPVFDSQVIDGMIPDDSPRLNGFLRQVCGLSSAPVFEGVITKGQGEYRSVIGFLDLFIPFEAEQRFDGLVERKNSYGRPDHTEIWDPHRTRNRTRHCLAFEVKISPLPVSDAIRQIKLYREFFNAPFVYYQHNCFWLLASAFDISAADKLMLRQSKILHVRLGAGFEAWAREQQQADEITPSTSIEV